MDPGDVMRFRPVPGAFLVLVAGLGTARPAAADATAFLGVATSPVSRQVRGFAVGASIVIVGFEFEYANVVQEPRVFTSDAVANPGPELTTAMGNVSVQTPTRIQLYATTGAGLYRERLGTQQETNIGLNNGAGVKIPLAGPIRVRFDYRVFTLRGSPVQTTTQRFYAGVNLAF